MVRVNRRGTRRKATSKILNPVVDFFCLTTGRSQGAVSKTAVSKPRADWRDGSDERRVVTSAGDDRPAWVQEDSR